MQGQSVEGRSPRRLPISLAVEEGSMWRQDERRWRGAKQSPGGEVKRPCDPLEREEVRPGKGGGSRRHRSW